MGMRIDDEIYVHGYLDEIRQDKVIVRNEGGYFGTVVDELVEAIPKDQYEELIKTNSRLVTDNNELRADIIMMKLDYKAKLKADMVAMLEDLDLQIDESAAYNREYAKIQRLIRDRIDKLKGEEDGNK